MVTAQTMANACYSLGLCLADYKNLMDAGWQVTTSLGQTSVTYTLTVAQQNAIIAEYTTLKAQLSTLYAQLP